MHSSSMYSASFAANRVVEPPTHRPSVRFGLTCCLFALLLISVVPAAHAVVVGPRWAYILDPAGLVHTYTVNRNSGAVALAAGCVPVPAGISPVSIKIDPSNSFVFVADNVGDAIFGFTINPGTGCLAPTAQIAIATGAGTTPASLHITASGKYLYVSETNGAAAAVAGYTIAPGTGALALIPGFPMNYGAHQGPLAYDPAGDFLLTADDSAPVGPILSFDVIAGGALAFDAASPTVLPNPNDMTIDPVRGCLLVLSGAPVLDSYFLNPVTGVLGPVNNQATGAGPVGVAATSIGQLAYVTNNAASSVSSYSIMPGCVLAKFAGADTLLRAPALHPTKSTIDPNGEFLYTADQTGHVSIFRITAGKAAEIAAVSSPFVLTYVNPAGIAITQ